MASSEDDNSSNAELEERLERYKEMLSASNSDKDDIKNKFQEVSSKMESLIQLNASDIETEEAFEEQGYKLNIEFKQKFEQEMAGYRQRILSYQENQDRQSLVIKELQSKVENYQQQCQKLEKDVSQFSLDDTQQERKDISSGGEMESMDLPTALLRLEEEKNRSRTLMHLNTMLRDQLEIATKTNQDLTSDIHHLMQDWEHTKEELDIKEAEWREEEQSFNDYFTKEHHRLLALWRHLLKFRHNYSEMKSAIERDLSQLRAHINHISHSIVSACLSLLTSTPPSQRISDNLAIDLQRKIQENLETRLQFDLEKNELKERIRELNSEKEKLNILLQEKEKMILALNKTVGNMDSINEATDQSVDNSAYVHQLQEELNFVNNALLEIAHVIIKDADSTNLSSSFTDQVYSRQLLSLRSALQEPVVDSYNLSSRERERSVSPEIVESTVAAVQTAFNKFRLQIEELHAKFMSAQEQVKLHKKMLDDANDERRNLQVLNSQLSIQLSTIHQDFLRSKTLEENGSERSAAEQMQRALNEQIDALNAENDRLHHLVNENRRKIEDLEDAKEELKTQESHLQEELEACYRQNSNLEQKLSTLRDEAAGLREVIKKLRLENEVLQEERNGIKNSLLQSERKRTEAALELEKVQYEENSLRDTVQNLQNFNEALEQDKLDLTKQITELQDTRRKLLTERTNLEQEQQKLLNTISHLEQQLQETEAKNVAITASLQVAEAARDHLDEQLSQITQSKRELEIQLSSQNNKLKMITDELQKTQSELKKQQEAVHKVLQEKDEKTKLNTELKMRLSTLEEERDELNTNLSTVQLEREQLERTLYNLQQTVSSVQQKVNELTQEAENWKIHAENLRGQLSDLKKRKELEEEMFSRNKESLNQKIKQLEEESSKILQQERQKSKQELEKIVLEKDTQIAKLEASHAEFVQKMHSEQEELVSKHEMEISSIKSELSNLQREWEEKYSLACSEKKVAEDLFAQEKSSLTQKLTNAQKETSRIQALLDETKQTLMAASEKDRAALSESRAELQKLKAELQNTVTTLEKEAKELNNQILDVKKERDAAQEEIVQLRNEIQTSEKIHDSLKQELSEANEKIKELEAKCSALSKEKVSAWNQADAEKSEKEIIQKSNEELRNKMKALELEKAEVTRNYEEMKQRSEILESAKSSIQKELSELRGTLRDVEKSRLDSKRELQSAKRHIASLETQIKEQEELILDLKAGIAKEEQKQSDTQQDAATLKQKLMAAEAGREAARKEMLNLQRKVVDLDHRLQLEKDTHLSAVEEHQAVQQRWEEQRASFERTLLQLNNEIQDLRLKLSISEGKATALESHLVKLENAKQDVEGKLTSLHAALRLTLGLGTDIIGTASPISTRSPWSSRHASPAKSPEADGESPVKATSPFQETSHSKSATPSKQSIKWNVSEVDVELIRAALYDLIQKLHSIEVEKDDWKSQCQRYQRLLEETKEEHSNVLTRMQQLQKFVGDVESGKKDADSQLINARTTILHQEDTIQRLEKEKKSLLERLTANESDIIPWESQKKHLQEKISQLKQFQKQADQNHRILVEAREKAELRAGKLELSKQMLEGEFQKLQLLLKDSNNEKQELQQEVDQMKQRIHEIEGKNSSLQIMVERLTLALQKSSEGENELREKVTTLNKSLNEKSSSATTVTEQLKQLRRELGNSEQERSALQKALENAKQSMNELKRKNKLLGDQLKQANGELMNLESLRNELSSELRNYQMTSSKSQMSEDTAQLLQQLQKENRQLRDQVFQLQQALTQAEAERKHLERLQTRLEKDKASLQRSLEKAARERLHTEELAHKTVLERSTLSHTLSALENENVELQKKIQNLQVQLAEAEQQHSQHMSDLAARYQQECHMEVERLRTALRQVEQRSETKERILKQKILSLEQQINALKEQLVHEQNRWHQYQQAGSEIRALRFTLDSSLRNVSEDPHRLAHEARKLDSAIEQHLSSTPVTTPASLTTPQSSRISRSPSPARRLVDTSSTRHPSARRRLDKSSPSKD